MIELLWFAFGVVIHRNVNRPLGFLFILSASIIAVISEVVK